MSDLQQALTYFQLLDYAISILITGVVYDYFLTFSREVEYIWLKPWTWVSTLFVLIRYLGIIQALLIGITNNSSFPSTPTTYDPNFSSQTKWLTIAQVYSTSGIVVYQASVWIFPMYLAAVDLAMILRIYAMWSRSKIILGFCLFIYVSNTIYSIVAAAAFFNPDTYLSATTERFLNMSICYIMLNLPSPIWLYLFPGYLVSASLLILPLIQTCKESLSMYRATKKWQPNRYMKLLVRDGIAYFVVRSSYDIQWAINYGLNTPFNFSLPFTELLSLMLMFSMLPRFIIGIRVLYDHDTHRQGIDTGFGILSRFVPAMPANVTLSGTGFVDDDNNGQIGDRDMIPLPVITSQF